MSQTKGHRSDLMGTRDSGYKRPTRQDTLVSICHSPRQNKFHTQEEMVYHCLKEYLSSFLCRDLTGPFLCLSSVSGRIEFMLDSQEQEARINNWGFPGCPVVRTSSFHCRSIDSMPLGGLRSCVPCCAALRKERIPNELLSNSVFKKSSSFMYILP